MVATHLHAAIHFTLASVLALLGAAQTIAADYGAAILATVAGVLTAGQTTSPISAESLLTIDGTSTQIFARTTIAVAAIAGIA